MARVNFNDVGRLVENPELKYIPGDNAKAVARFKVAFDRGYKEKEKDEYISDFHQIEVWGGLAEYVGENIGKGTLIQIQGQLQNNNYEKDGKTVYGYKIVASSIRVLEKPRNLQSV